MLKFAVVICRLLLLALLFSTVFGEESGEECSGISYSSHDVINRKTGKMSHSVNFSLMHMYGKCSPYRPPNSTWESLVSEMMRTYARRHKSIRRSTADFQSWEDVDVPVASGNPIVSSYIIEINIGSPAQRFYPVIDTGSDVTFIRCNPCWMCDLQTWPSFMPSRSSSYRVLGCQSQKCPQVYPDAHGCENLKCIFQQFYVDQSGFVAKLSADSLSVGSQTVPHFAFGCVEIEINEGLGPALIGLGRGNLSFVSQTAHLYDKTFSYCLPSFELDKFSGSLIFGIESLNAKGLQFTPLLTNPKKRFFYYIGLKNISVGGELLSIPPETFTLNISTGVGGTIIDSGSTYTSLVEPAYSILRDAFKSKLSNLHENLITPAADSIFDTCYKISAGSMLEAPLITFHFEGGLDLELTQENILQNLSDTVVCLGFLEELSAMSTIGAVQQQNWRIVYDIPNSRIGFARERCSM
eukprot:Gb_22648 [translate_table: standard]